VSFQVPTAGEYEDDRQPSGIQRRVVSKLTDVSDVRTASVIETMMETVRIALMM
jgi:hypothetical protein